MREDELINRANRVAKSGAAESRPCDCEILPVPIDALVGVDLLAKSVLDGYQAHFVPADRTDDRDRWNDFMRGGHDRSPLIEISDRLSFGVLSP